MDDLTYVDATELERLLNHAWSRGDESMFTTLDVEVARRGFDVYDRDGTLVIARDDDHDADLTAPDQVWQGDADAHVDVDTDVG